ncbi:GH32 C-terminal domain-containing protein [Streptomyces sp. NPDC002172]
MLQTEFLEGFAHADGHQVLGGEERGGRPGKGEEFPGGLDAVHAAPYRRGVQNASGEQVVLTDQIFPDPADTGVGVFADDGTAKLGRLKAWQLASLWK